MTGNTRLATVGLILGCWTLGAGASQESGHASLPQRFSAFAVSVGGPRTNSVATRVEIVINRWSTQAESKQLMTALEKGGPDKLLDTLQDLKPVGTISTPGNLAYDLHYADQEKLDEGGRGIFLATDRPISFWEAVNRPRVNDYPFTFIEMHLNGEGEGEGKLNLATKIAASSNDRHIELVGYAAQPISLNTVRLQKP